MYIIGVRSVLLDTDDHTCPGCHESDQSPASLIANKFLRTAVRNFLNETGYTSRKAQQLAAEAAQAQAQAQAQAAAAASHAEDVAVPQDAEVPNDMIGMPPQVCCFGSDMLLLVLTS